MESLEAAEDLTGEVGVEFESVWRRNRLAKKTTEHLEAEKNLRGRIGEELKMAKRNLAKGEYGSRRIIQTLLKAKNKNDGCLTWVTFCLFTILRTVHERFWFCLGQVSTTQFCRFSLVLMASVDGGSGVRVSPMLGTSSNYGCPNGSGHDLDGTGHRSIDAQFKELRDISLPRAR